MSDQVSGKFSEKIMRYGEVATHIRTPEEPRGLALIAHGNALSPNDPLVLTIRNAMNARGLTTIIPDLGTQEGFDDPGAIHAAFAKKVKTAFDGYIADHPDAPASLAFVGHSLGGAAIISLAKDYPVAELTILDPTPLDREIFRGLNCPTAVILSNVRSFKSSGTRMQRDIAELSPHPGPHVLHQLATSPERPLGHMFRGNEADVARILRATPDSPAPEPHPEP